MINLAMAIVGTTQIIKNLIPWKGSRVVWTIVTIAVGIALTLLMHMSLVEGIVSTCAATLFYDNVYKFFEHLFEGGLKNESIGAR